MTDVMQPSTGPVEAAEGDSAALERLEAVIRNYGPTLTAYSGGVDSSLVAFVAHRVHGGKALAVTGVSASLSDAEYRHAQTLASDLGMQHRFVATFELASPDYRANRGDRCFHCKSELFSRLIALARDQGYAVVATGDNLDDLEDDRPGMRAAERLGVRHPLLEARLGKAQIRRMARSLGLGNWQKVASPCLASRIPVGTHVDAATLARIEAAESVLRALGFVQFRVRHHGELARIEVAADELQRGLSLRLELVAALREVGYRWITLDLAGFRGEALPIVAR